MIVEAPIRRLEHRGGVLELRRTLEAIETTDKVLEFVVEGPRGTGKSNGTAYCVWKFCRYFMGVRVLVIRTSRSLLTDTFCKTYEEDVCPGHASISKTQRTQRHEYIFPETGSRIVLGGLDDCARYYGSDWDIVVVEEAVEFGWKDIEPFLGSLRNAKLPFHALIYATNPGDPGSWVNRRAIDGFAKRLKCVLYDNPSLWDRDRREWTDKGRMFMDSLSRYTGVAKARHVLGLWKGAEGMVWDNWDESIHMIDKPTRDTDLGINRYFMSADWGHSEPGSLSVWGLDGEKRMVRVAHCYHTKKNTDWWADWAIRFVEQYHISRAVGDPSRPNEIDLVNSRLVKAKCPGIFYGADNKRRSDVGGDLAGLDLVRWGLELDTQGIPRIRIVKGSLMHPPDPELVAAGVPWAGEAEIPGYVYARDASSDALLDKTDSACADHFCDEMRYAAADNWRRETRKYEPPEWVPPPGTYAHQYGTPASLAKQKRKDEDD